MKSRSIYNFVNVFILASLNSSLIVTGYPKTGTTYLSYVFQSLLSYPYLAGSKKFAFRPSIIHSHWLRKGRIVASYRSPKFVYPSFVVHRLRETGSLADFRKNPLDFTKYINDYIDHALLKSSRYGSMSCYYQKVVDLNIPVINIADVYNGLRLLGKETFNTRFSHDKIIQAVAEADSIKALKTSSGDEFYNSPTKLVFPLIKPALRDEIALEEERLARILRL